MAQQQQQQQQYYASSPNHNDFHGYYVEPTGNNLGMQLNGTHPSHMLDHLDDPHSDPIPNIYEQTPESDGFNDLRILSDPTIGTMDSILQHSFGGLGLHSPTQPSQAGEFAPYLPPSTKPDPSSPIYPTGPPSPSQVVVPSQRSSPTPLNLSNLSNVPDFLSPAHSPSLSPHIGGGNSPSSEVHTDWESSSQLSFDGGCGSNSPPDAGGLGLRRSHSAGSANVGEGKSYRRNIEKKSRDKKNDAYTRLKKQLEDITHKSYSQRSQAEVLDGATNLLAQKEQDCQLLSRHNQALIDKLKQYGLWESD